MTSSNSTDTTLSPTQLQRLHQLMDRGDSFVTSDVEQCRRALVESSEIKSFDTVLSNAACAASRRFSNPRYVGCGAFGIVFFVFDDTLGMDVAIKLLRPSRNSSVVQQRFLEEAKITANLSHPGIIRLYDSGTIGAIPYITSTLASSGSLADLLAKHLGGMDAQLACELMIQVADAVAFSHSKATFHRDLKPGNILMDADPEQPSGLRTIISDFGLAKRWNQGPADAALTLEGDVLGTARYMSPEQARGDLAAFSITSEVFTLGIILYEMLTGRIPFAGDSSSEIRREIIEGQPERVRSVRSDISRDLEAIVMQCLQKAPEDRYESVASLAKDLRRFRDQEPVEAANPSLLRRFTWQAHKHPIVSSVVTVSTLLVCLSLLGVSLAWWRQSQAWQREFQTKMDYIGLFGSLIDDVVAGTKDQNTVLIESLVEFQKNVEKDLQSNPGSLKLEHLLSVLLNYQSVVFGRQQQYSESLRCRIDSTAVIKKLRYQHADNARIRYQYIHGMMDLISFLSQKIAADQRSYCQHVLGFSDFREAENEMLSEIIQLEKEFPHEADYVLAGHQFRLDLIKTSWSLDPEQADRKIDDVIAASRAFADAHPDKLLYIKPAIFADQVRCANHLTIGNNQSALRYGNEGLKCFNTYLKPHLSLAWVKVLLVNYEVHRTEALLVNGLCEEAIDATVACEELLKQIETPTYFPAFRFALLHYLAAKKLGRNEELPGLHLNLVEKAKLMPPANAAGFVEWAEQLHADEDVLSILRQAAAQDTTPSQPGA